jgi:hypothetical protein
MLTEGIHQSFEEEKKTYKGAIMEEFKKCPFCGESVAIVYKPTDLGFEDDDGQRRVVCSILNKGCGGGASWEDSKEEAIKAWNTRTGGWISVEDRLKEAENLIRSMRSMIGVASEESFMNWFDDSTGWIDRMATNPDCQRNNNFTITHTSTNSINYNSRNAL